MNFQQHILKMRKIQNALIRYIESDYHEDELFTKLIKLLKELEIPKNHMEFSEFLHLLSNISSHHPRGTGFFDKIFKILQQLKKDIKSNFSDSLIYNIFKENKRIVLFFIEEKIVDVANIFNSIDDSVYFFPEIKPFLNQKDIDFYSSKIPEDLVEKRKNGENEMQICKMIREDMIDDFISYVTKKKNSTFFKNPNFNIWDKFIFNE